MSHALGGPVPDAPPVSTIALDWAERARRDRWELTGGLWQHEQRADAYDDDWVYLGDGVWEDAEIASLNPGDHRAALDRYDAVRRDVIDTVRRAADTPNRRHRRAPTGLRTPKVGHRAVTGLA